MVDLCRQRFWNRRTLLAIVVAALLLPARLLSAAELTTAWIQAEIELAARGDLEKPPIVTDLAVDPSGSHVAIAGDDHLIRIWEIERRRFSAELSGHQDWVRTLRYSPDGTLLASAGNDGRLVIWDVASRQITHHHNQPHPITRVLFDPTGAQFATIGFRSPLRYFSVATGAEIRSMVCPCEDMRAMAISPRGRFLAGGGRNGKIRIWHTASGEVAAEFIGHRQRIRAIEFSPDGTWIASCGDDRVIRISRVDGTEAFFLKGPSAKQMSLAFCGPTKLAAGGSDNLVRIWDLESREETAQLAGHTGTVMALAYAGGTLVSAGYDTKVCVWKRSRNIAGDRSVDRPRVGERVRDLESR